MDGTWILLLIVWGIVEFIQFLRKKSYPQRMRTGAFWGVAFASVSALGSASPNVDTLSFLAVSTAIYGAGSLLICGIRTALTKLLSNLFLSNHANQSQQKDVSTQKLPKISTAQNLQTSPNKTEE